MFEPDGERLALVMSEGDASEIYTVDATARDLRRLTRNRAIDVVAELVARRQQIAFVSDRTGAPQVYVMNADGSDQRRLTFNGSYNTNPPGRPTGCGSPTSRASAASSTSG